MAIKKVSKKAAVKSPVKRKNTKEMQNAIDIVLEIGDFCRDNNNVDVMFNYGMGGSAFVVIAKTVELTVNRVKNHSVFQPYEKNEVGEYCLLSVIQIGDFEGIEIPELVQGIIAIGCPVHKITHAEEVARVLDGIGK